MVVHVDLGVRKLDLLRIETFAGHSEVLECRLVLFENSVARLQVPATVDLTLIGHEALWLLEPCLDSHHVVLGPEIIDLALAVFTRLLINLLQESPLKPDLGVGIRPYVLHKLVGLKALILLDPLVLILHDKVELNDSEKLSDRINVHALHFVNHLLRHVIFHVAYE